MGGALTFLSVWGHLGTWRYSVRQIPASICDVLQGSSDTDQYVDIVRVEDLPLTEIHKYKNPNASSSLGLDLELQAHSPPQTLELLGLSERVPDYASLTQCSFPHPLGSSIFPLPCWNALLPRERVGEWVF